MLDIRRFENGLQIVPNPVGNTAPNMEGELAVWDTGSGTASFSGVISGTSTSVTITSNSVGSPGNSVALVFVLTKASATDTLDSPNIVFTASQFGTIGNSISLVFDGVMTVGAVTTAWNLANPSNTVVFTGLSSVVPVAQTVNLSGGVQTSISSAISTWNTAHPSNTVTLTSGDGTQLPSSQTLHLSGAGDGNLYYNNGTSTYPISAAITGFTGDISSTPGPGVVDVTVLTVGGVTAAEIAAAVHSSQAGTPLDTPNTLVLRDNTGSFAATNITANLLGNATTATLAGNVTGIVSPFNGGTGISNANSSTITITNPFPLTLSYPAPTSLVLPVTGTLATLSGAETFANKTFSNQQVWQQITTPVSNPPSGSVDIYAKADNNIYVLTSSGLESPINGGANPIGSITMFGGTSNASFTGTIAGTQTSVSIAAVSPGQAGNSIALSFNGVKATAVDTIDVPNITFIANFNGTIGNSISLVFNGVAATVTDNVDSPNIIFTANYAGTAGNSISLVFNGATDTVTNVVNAWNTAHPTNTVSFTGFGTVIPAANTWTLGGGSGSTVTTIVTAWNTANPTNTVAFTGSGSVVPFAQTVNLSGGSGISINTAISNWNTANPSNQAVLSSGDGTQIPNTGASAPFTGSTIPAGWLLCDGAAVSRAVFSNLFATIGFNFGQGSPATQSVAHLTTVADVSSAAFGNIGTNTITAVMLGLIGNSISLSFDGVMTVSQVVFNWNTLNPSNQVTQVGNGANVYPAQTLNLSNGTSNTDGKYFEIYDDVGLVVAWIKTASTTMQPVVGGATRYIQLNGVTTGDPAIAIATAIASDLAADGSFTPTTSSSNVVFITNTSFITHPAGNAGTTPFTYVQTDSGGLSTFNLPDMRGMFARGTDPTGINDPDFASRTAVNGGNSGGQVGSSQVDAVPDHDHYVVFRAGAGGIVPEAPGGGGTYIYPTSTIYQLFGTETVISTESRPKNLNINYIIKF